MKSPYSLTDIQRPENEAEPVKCVSLDRYERCGFCQSKIVFSHDLDMTYLEVIEKGRCPGCGVSLNPRKFTLQ